MKAVINQIEVDKIGSATSLLGLARSLSIVSKNGTPRAGDVVVARVLTDNATYNMLELPTGRLAKVNPGDVIVGVLGRRRALKGFVGDVPVSVNKGDELYLLNLGGVIGSGKQWMSWISLDDQIAVINFVLENEDMRGAVNSVSPNPVTNQEFTAAMGEVLYRPTFIPIPEFAVHLAFGEMGDALLLDSTKVMPKRLEEASFEFNFPDLKKALQHAVE